MSGFFPGPCLEYCDWRHAGSFFTPPWLQFFDLIAEWDCSKPIFWNRTRKGGWHAFAIPAASLISNSKCNRLLISSKRPFLSIRLAWLLVAMLKRPGRNVPSYPPFNAKVVMLYVCAYLPDGIKFVIKDSICVQTFCTVSTTHFYIHSLVYSQCSSKWSCWIYVCIQTRTKEDFERRARVLRIYLSLCCCLSLLNVNFAPMPLVSMWAVHLSLRRWDGANAPGQGATL